MIVCDSFQLDMWNVRASCLLFLSVEEETSFSDLRETESCNLFIIPINFCDFLCEYCRMSSDTNVKNNWMYKTRLYISICKCIKWSEGQVESDQWSQPLSMLSSCCSALPAVSRKTLCVTASLFRAWKMQLGSRSSLHCIVSGTSCFLSAQLWLLFGQRGGNSTTVRLLTVHWGQDAVFTEDFLTLLLLSTDNKRDTPEPVLTLRALQFT